MPEPEPEYVSISVIFTKADHYRLEWYASKTGVSVGKAVVDAVNGMIDGAVRRAVHGTPEKKRTVLNRLYEWANPLAKTEVKEPSLF